jgi:hypothetical protein
MRVKTKNLLRLGSEPPNECCEVRRDRTRNGVVLVPQGFPNYQHPNASTATGKPLRRLGSVTVLNYMPGDPLMDRVSGGERGHSHFPRLRLLIRANHEPGGCPTFLLNIEKRSLLRLMLSGDGLASNEAV